MEVVYDLDRIGRGAPPPSRGIRLVRSATPGTDPRFVAMICDLVDEADGRAPAGRPRELGPAACPCRRGCCGLQAAASVGRKHAERR